MIIHFCVPDELCDDVAHVLSTGIDEASDEYPNGPRVTEICYRLIALLTKPIEPGQECRPIPCELGTDREL